jgi:sigma-B regulation protein RsbU (phosphoserine phosphatase)
MSNNLLGRIPLFTNLPDDELARLQSELQVVNLKPGEILFREGEPGEHLYVVLSGDLEILMGPGTDNELILNVVHKEEYVGEMSLLQPDGHRSTAARARTDLVLLSMSRSQFRDLLSRHPELSRSMISVLNQRLVNTNVQTVRVYSEKNRQLQIANDDLNKANDDLKKANDDLKAAQAQLIEKARMERELKVASDIQMSILPDVLPEYANFDFGGRILPARQVGGDFYDVFDLGENRVGVLIGDVADKGVPSAIFMARAHALIIAEADTSTSPGEVLRKVNTHITRLEKSTQFVTALYGVLDTVTGVLTYARAGHEPPLLLSADGTIERLPFQSGMALGLWENIALDEHSFSMPKGSLLVLFTDGMTDCRNPKGEPFGLERVKKTMSGLNAFTAQYGCDQLFDTLMQYQNGSKQDDDVTLVAIHAK